MKKRALLISSLFLINFVSAYYGSYTSFSLSDLLDSIDPPTMILGAVFIISFAFINFALLKVFKDKYGESNRATAGVVAFAISLLITYGINRTGFDFEGLFFDIGISSDLLYVLLPLILLAALIYLLYKFKSKTLVVLGLLFIVITFTDIIYSKGATMLIGIFLLGIGIWLWWRGERSPKKLFSSPKEPMDYAQRAKELRDKQMYGYYKGLEEQQKKQEQQQKRDEARELRRRKARGMEPIGTLKERYIRRYGKRAWKKREQQGI